MSGWAGAVADAHCCSTVQRHLLWNSFILPSQGSVGGIKRPCLVASVDHTLARGGYNFFAGVPICRLTGPSGRLPTNALALFVLPRPRPPHSLSLPIPLAPFFRPPLFPPSPSLFPPPVPSRVRQGDAGMGAFRVATKANPWYKDGKTFDDPVAGLNAGSVKEQLRASLSSLRCRGSLSLSLPSSPTLAP